MRKFTLHLLLFASLAMMPSCLDANPLARGLKSLFRIFEEAKYGLVVGGAIAYKAHEDYQRNNYLYGYSSDSLSYLDLLKRAPAQEVLVHDPAYMAWYWQHRTEIDSLIRVR